MGPQVQPWAPPAASRLVTASLVGLLLTTACNDPCHDLDVLLVVDDSPSMREAGAAIAAAVPVWARDLESAFGPETVLHVGVVTSGAYAGNDGPCRIPGALVRSGTDKAPGDLACGPFEDGRYLTQEDDLAAGLKCVTKVGAGGDVDEDLLDSAVAALSPEARACNGSFIREGSRLVVAFVTDEDLAASPSRPAPSVPSPPQAPPARLDVAIVVDTTGSMTSELGAMKQHLRAIIRRMGNASPPPDIRVGIVAFRDRGDSYVTQTLPFLRDLDRVDAFIGALVADQGGDAPEAVNRALMDALELDWDSSPGTGRLLFLVGDAPPHRYPDEPDWEATAASLSAKGIVVQSIGCAQTSAEARAAFEKTSSSTGGAYEELTYRGTTLVASRPRDILVQGAYKVLPDDGLPARAWKTGARRLLADGKARPAPLDLPPPSITENNLDHEVLSNVQTVAMARGARFDPPTSPARAEDAPSWAERIASASRHPRDQTVLVAVSRGPACDENDDGQDASALPALARAYTDSATADLCAPSELSSVFQRALSRAAEECLNAATCRERGPRLRDWLFSSLALLLVGLIMGAVGFSTLSRALARDGRRLAQANLAALGLGALGGGIAALVVAVLDRCGIASGPGYLGAGVALVGAAILVIALAARRAP